MLKQKLLLALAISVLPLAAARAGAGAGEPPVRLAMMDMMPMGGGGMPGAPGTRAAPAAGMGMGGMSDDMMRMGPGGTQPAQGGAMPGMPNAPGGQAGSSAGAGVGGMSDDTMRMGGDGMPAQGQGPTAPGQAAQPPMSMCVMMATMMQNMMRMGASPQGMPSMPGGPGPGAAADGGAAAGAQHAGSSAARLEGRIAFLRAELRITEAQAPAWDAFANALRAGREHLDAARAALRDSATAADPMARLESFEAHLRARMDTIHATRMAFDALYGQLDEAQKRAATATMLPFVGSF